MIQSIWGADATLIALCPVNRLFFEQLDDTDRLVPEYPYTVMKILDDDPIEVSSGSYFDEAIIEFVTYADTYESAVDIQRESRRVLRAGDVNPTDDGLPLLFERRGGSLGGQDGMVYVAVDEYSLTRQRQR